MEFVFLSKDFYNDYVGCIEIEKKDNRPYVMVIATIDNVDFAIPLRSNINHKHVVWTDKLKKCGLDLSKAVIIKDRSKYVDYTRKPYIRPNEFKVLKGKDYFIKQKLEKYIRDYKKALEKQDILINRLLCQFSTLQYFHNELGI